MTAPLTPALALAYLRELSVDVRAAVVLGADGRPIAGDTQFAPSVREMTTAGEERRVEAGGTLLAARTADGGAIAVLAGDSCPLGLLEHDLAAAAAALATSSDDRSGT
jgi:predicted regulator of Ras-like GTPase activity (Roadblock/LC7/MglB family)